MTLSQRTVRKSLKEQKAALTALNQETERRALLSTANRQSSDITKLNGRVEIIAKLVEGMRRDWRTSRGFTPIASELPQT